MVSVSYTEFQEYAEVVPPKHFHEKAWLVDSYKKFYSRWYSELQNGFNLLFYGVGSKKSMILDFAYQ